MSLDYVVAIPARMASTRLKDKPLALIDGVPMIVRVCAKALESQAREVIACIDDERVSKALEELASSNPRLVICMTSDKPRSGTERIAEMIGIRGLKDDTVIVNVQGDEPLITPEHIDMVAERLISSGAAMSTLVSPITNINDVFDPNCVKAVMNKHNMALYFSRAPIPYERDNFAKGDVRELTTTHYHHIGIYGYSARTIVDYLAMEQAEIERAESLEQLRMLHHGFNIAISVTLTPPEAGVDTQSDLERVNAIFREAKS